MNRVFKHMQQVCMAGFEAAVRHNSHIAIVAVDTGGHFLVVMRADRAPFSAVEAARRKAVAAASMQMTTAAIAEMFRPDPLVITAMSASGDMLIVPGGFPVVLDHNCIGGIGIAGGHYTEDDAIGRQAIAGALVP
jgi:uncharacterized protein GlcG (DUF336 family)